MGLITFAFGMGGPVANFAGLLHMTVHSLVKSAIFFTVGHATQKAGTQVMSEIRGLIKVNPTVGWGLMLGVMAILGMPPFGVFASEFLILTTAMREQPWAAPFLFLALGVAFASILIRVLPMVFGDTTLKPLAHPPALDSGVCAPGAGAGAGLVHSALSEWLVRAGRQHVGRLSGMQIPGLRRLNLHALARAGADLARAGDAGAVASRRHGGARRGRALAGAVGRRDGPDGRAQHGALPASRLCDAGRVVLAVRCHRRAGSWLYPDLAAVFPAAARMQRAAADLSGMHALGRPGHSALAQSRRLAARPFPAAAGRRPVAAAGGHRARQLPVCACRGRWRA